MQEALAGVGLLSLDFSGATEHDCCEGALSERLDFIRKDPRDITLRRRRTIPSYEVLLTRYHNDRTLTAIHAIPASRVV